MSPTTMPCAGAVALLYFLISNAEAHFFRIVNGSFAEEGEFPFAVSLRINKRHTCGATILDREHVLTAAHCTCRGNEPQKSNNYSVQFGSINLSESEERSINVSKIMCHDYSPTKLKYDAAVLKLKSPIPEEYYVPVTLAKEFDTSKNSSGTIIGWGFTSTHGPISKTLKKTDVQIYSNEICSKLESSDPDHHICFGDDNSGACFGDSGTALLVEGQQVGIASFITNEECGIANPETPNVYAKVSTYYDWIMEQMED